MKGTKNIKKYADLFLNKEERSKEKLEVSQHGGLMTEEDAVKKASTLIYIDLNDLCKKGIDVEWDSLLYDISTKEIDGDCFCKVNMRVIAGALARTDSTLFMYEKGVVSSHNITKAVRAMIEYYKRNVLKIA